MLSTTLAVQCGEGLRVANAWVTRRRCAVLYDVSPAGVWFNVTDIYSRLVFPLMGSNQSALYVPPAYSSTPGAAANKTCPPKGDCEAEMLAWAVSATTLARDSRPATFCAANVLRAHLCARVRYQPQQDAMRWASAPDSRIIGLVPWHWKSYDGVGRFVTGASTMPAVRALWAAIGDKIING